MRWVDPLLFLRRLAIAWFDAEYIYMSPSWIPHVLAFGLGCKSYGRLK